MNIYRLVTAAQALVEDGRPFGARGLLQSARIVATSTSEFLALNGSQIEIDISEANEIIAKRAGELESKREGGER